MALSDQLPLLGPVMGPIAGGFVAQTVGIKWVFIVISSLSFPFYRQCNLFIIAMMFGARFGDRIYKHVITYLRNVRITGFLSSLFL